MTSQDYLNLCWAIDADDVDRIQVLLNKGVSINIQDEFGCTPMIHAVKRNNVSAVQFLIDQGASVDVCDKTQRSPIFFAIIQDNIELIQMLINNGVSINDICCEGSTILFFAIGLNRNKSAKFLIEQGATVNALKLEDSPLYNAVCSDNAEIIPFLIHAGAFVNQRDSKGNSLVNIAMKSGNYEPAETLLQMGARCADSIELLYFALERRHNKLFTLLLNVKANVNISYRDGKPFLHTVMESDHDHKNFNFTMSLLKKNADPNVKAKDGVDPIFLAAFLGDVDLFLLLLEHGGKVDIYFKKDGKSLLDHAIKNGCAEIVEDSLKNCKIIPEKLGGLLKRLVLQNEGYYGYKKCVSYLCAYGFHCDKSDALDEEFVSMIIWNGHFELFQDLINFGLDVNLVGNVPRGKDFLECLKYGNKCFPETASILQMAVLSGQKDIAMKLILLEADVTVTDSASRTALFYAIRNDFPSEIIDEMLPKINVHQEIESFNCAVWRGSFKVVNYFLANGYKVNEKDVYRKTSLYCSVSGEHFDCSRVCKMSKNVSNINRGKIVELLTGYNDEMNNDVTILAISIKKGFLKVAEILLKYIDVNCTVEGIEAKLNISLPLGYPNYGLEPFCSLLHIAATNYDKTDFIDLLIKWNADVNKENETGLTPLQIAALGGNCCAMKSLINAGASIKHCDKNGMSALFFAFLKPKNEAFKVLIMLGADQITVDIKNRTILDDLLKTNRLYSWNSVKMTEYIESCKLEVASMKSVYVDDYSLYDILSIPVTRLVRYLRVENISADIIKEWQIKYPNYRSFFVPRLTEAQSRRKLLDDFEPLLQKSIPYLPNLCLVKITDFFSNEELSKIFPPSNTNQN